MVIEFETLSIKPAELQKLKKIAEWKDNHGWPSYLVIRFHNESARKDFLKMGFIKDGYGFLTCRGKTRLKILKREAVSFDTKRFNSFFYKKIKKSGKLSPSKLDVLVSILRNQFRQKTEHNSSVLRDFYYLLFNDYIVMRENNTRAELTIKAREVFEKFQTDECKRILKFENEKPPPGDILVVYTFDYKFHQIKKIHVPREIKNGARYMVSEESPFNLSLININTGKTIYIMYRGYETHTSSYTYIPIFNSISWIDDIATVLMPLHDAATFLMYQPAQRMLLDSDGLTKLRDLSQKHELNLI
jgi:hypothetical protein